VQKNAPLKRPTIHVAFQLQKKNASLKRQKKKSGLLSSAKTLLQRGPNNSGCFQVQKRFPQGAKQIQVAFPPAAAAASTAAAAAEAAAAAARTRR
jgi:hypothetical protein